MAARSLALAAVLTAALGCRGEAPRAPAVTAPRPSILLVTLDTIRADHVAPEAPAADTPTIAGLAARGTVFSQAYSTVPVTLPAHTAMMAGLYPSATGIHENGRRVPAKGPLLATELTALGYHTAAVVSGAPLDSAYGLDRGFATYDDDFGPGGNERKAALTTDRALAILATLPEPAFLWVHYFDAHQPYTPPTPFLHRFPQDPYRGEIAYVDEQLGRLVAAFEARFPAQHRLLVVGDHGEGRGEHGEEFHGNLLYQGTLRVPLVLVESPPAPGGTGPRRVDRPVSTSMVAATVLGWAAGEPSRGLLGEPPAMVLAEAMKPYLDYGWQPQVAVIRGSIKTIQAGAGDTQIFDLAKDPGEIRDLSGSVAIDREVRQALREYPLPGSSRDAPMATADPAQRERLASLGYLVSDSPPKLRANAPVPRRMTALFPDLDRASGWFSGGRFADAIPLFERVLREDPGNLAAALRLAAGHSALGHDQAALAAFDRARAIDPESPDVRHYLGLHYLRRGVPEAALRELGAALQATPDRLTTLEAYGEAAMALGDTAAALGAFERARDLAPQEFHHDLELGVLYLAANRLNDARESLDRVPEDHPGHAMALFKRAQVAVLAGEPDAAERIRQAREGADDTTRELVAREALFRR